MWANIKTKNRKQLKIKALIDSGCTHTGINKQLVKDTQIQMKPINFSFEVFNVDGTKNEEVTRVVLLEVKINSYKEQLEAVVMDLNGTNMFLEYNWLVKHNLEVNWKDRKIWFTKYLGFCKMKHQDIKFKTRRTQVIEIIKKDNLEIGKEPDKTNLKDLPDYIQLFIHLFNKKKFEKLLEQREWDHKINLMEEAPKELNAKTYAIIIKKEEALNQ